MKRDKFSKPFLPGAAKAEKAERDEAREKALAKKARRRISFAMPNGMGKSPDESQAFKKAYIGGWEPVSFDMEIVGVDMAKQSDKYEGIVVRSDGSLARANQMKEIGDLLSFIIAHENAQRPRTTEQLEQEFEGLMKNHERIMSHFK